jgi:hypothetical protein
MHQYLKDQSIASVRAIESSGTPGPVVFTATAADVKFLFTPSRAIDVVRWGYIVTTAKDATSMALTLSKRPTAGSASGKTVIGTITDTAARAVGDVVYQIPGELATAAATQSTAEDGSLRNVDPAGPYHVKVGEQLSIELTDVADVSGQGYLFVEYIAYPFSSNSADVVGTVTKITATT